MPTSPYQYRYELADEWFRRGGKLLDVGCGTGGFAARLGDKLGCEPYGIDVVDANTGSIDFQVYDGLTIPFDDDTFDNVCVIHVLHHADDAERLVREISRVTRPEGRLMIIEDMASSRLQSFLTKASDLYFNKARNLWRFITGRQRWGMVEVPMRYGIRSYPAWIELFEEHHLMVRALRSIPHDIIEHGVFVLEKLATPGGV